MHTAARCALRKRFPDLVCASVRAGILTRRRASEAETVSPSDSAAPSETEVPISSGN